jgi:hypothetical protein
MLTNQMMNNGINTMSWYDELDKEYDDMVNLRNRIVELEQELSELYAANSSNIIKAHNVFRCLVHIEDRVMKCPTCRAERDEDGILLHKKDCYLAHTLVHANDF